MTKSHRDPANMHTSISLSKKLLRESRELATKVIHCNNCAFVYRRGMTPSPELMLELLKDIWEENGRHYHLDTELAHRLRDLLAASDKDNRNRVSPAIHDGKRPSSV
jgi:hypothetical protein